MMPSELILGDPMELSLQEVLQSYNDQSPLEEAFTIPASWYVDERDCRAWNGNMCSAEPGKWWLGLSSLGSRDNS